MTAASCVFKYYKNNNIQDNLLGNYERFVERFLYEFEANFVLEIIIFIDVNIRNKKLKMFYI